MKLQLDKLSPKSQETYLRYCMQVDLKVSLDDVILSDENSKKVKEFMQERLNAYELHKLGLEPMNRILMYGASGTGKTYLTQALANRLVAPLLHIDVSQLQVDNIAGVITDIFELAAELRYAVIFLDECDSICWARDDVNNDDSAAVRRANNTLFQQLDQMHSDIMFISATNLYDNLDVAFKRRFNIEMKFLAPKITDFGSAIQRFLNPSFNYEQDMNIEVKKIVDYQAMNYSRMSYFQIKDWVHRVEKAAIFEKRKTIKESEIYEQLMSAMRIAVKYDSAGVPYLHQYGVQTR